MEITRFAQFKPSFSFEPIYPSASVENDRCEASSRDLHGGIKCYAYIIPSSPDAP